MVAQEEPYAATVEAAALGRAGTSACSVYLDTAKGHLAKTGQRQELDRIKWIRTDGARFCDLGELERGKIIFHVDRGLFECDLAKEGVRRRR